MKYLTKSLQKKTITIATWVLTIAVIVTQQSCDLLLNNQVKYSQEIFTTLTAPEEGGVNFTQLTKESDIY
jgi:hypothetical protein